MTRSFTLGLIFLLIVVTMIPIAVHATDFWIDGIEVTQSIQCFDQTTGYTSCPDNSLELTSGKPIAIRVYINHDGMKCPNGIPDKVVEANVPVTVSWVAGHKGETGAQFPTTIVKDFDVPCSTSLDNLRNDIDMWGGGERGSVVVIIPGDAVSLRKDAWLWVQAEIATTKGGVTIDPNPSNNKKEIMLGNDDPANFKPGVFLRNYKKIAWVVVKNKYTGIGDEKFAAQGGTLMKRTYPFPVYYYQGGSPLDWSCQECVCNYIGCTELTQKLLEYKMLMTPEPDALIGWVAPGLLGDAAGSAKHFTHTGWAEARSDLEFTNMIGAHEVGHMLGSNDHCNELGCSKMIEETGFYLMPFLHFNTQQVIPKNTADFMKSYPVTPGWISPVEYNILLGKGKMDCPPDVTKSSSGAQNSFSAANTHLTTSGITILGSSLGVSSTGPVPAVLVNGIAVYDGQHYSGALKPVFTLMSEGPFLENDPSGDYCIQFLNPSGPIAGERYCFKDHGLVAIDPPSGSTTTDDGRFGFKLPLPPGAVGIQLLQGDVELAKQVMSANTPVVTLNQPVGGMMNGKFTISWKGSDNDNDPLLYHVLYSPDQGSSWVPLATYISDTSLGIDPQYLAGGANGLIRVIVSDGFNTASVDSAPLQIIDKAPRVFIESPQDGVVIPVTHNLGLSALAQDLEDGMISGGQIVWTSDGNDQLGMGSELWLEPGRLSLGNHIITVKATDSAHQIASATVRLTVTQPAIAPSSAFTGKPLTGTAPLGVKFTDDSTGTSITNWRWDFGDGNISTYTVPTNPFHIYSNAGYYTVSLTVSGSGGSDSEVKTNYINVLLPVKVRIVPNTLNIASKGYFVAFVTLPKEYKAADVDATSVKCEGASALKLIRVKWFPQLFVAIFSREKLVGVNPEKNVKLTVTGMINKNGKTVRFSGSNPIKVISKATKTKEAIDDVMKMSDDKIFTQFNPG